MSTEYNKFFGWVPNFKFNGSSLIFGEADRRPPYPCIVRFPTLRQVVWNWNMADTGLTVCATVIGALISKRVSRYSTLAPISNQKIVYSMSIWAYTSLAIYLGLNNSYYRLTGVAANGLNWSEEPEPELVKYDFSSNFVEKSFWKCMFEEDPRK